MKFWLLSSADMNCDSRELRCGSVIPSPGDYADQPYIVRTTDGAWLCVLTTSSAVEGGADQHILALRSTDCGKTWEPPVPIEPPGPPESSWAMPLIVPSGRIYVFYLRNTANLRRVIANNEPSARRVDTLGDYYFRFSDDGGRTWSAQRYQIPIRPFVIDRQNPYQGEVRFFWGVGKPIIHAGKAYLGLSKVGSFGEGFIERSEGFFLCSDNILQESDPTRLRWETLPDGDVGLLAPRGPIAEEQNLVSLGDGTLYCVYRTTQGYLCHAYSRDDGRTWTAPQFGTYGPDGKPIKQPRAAAFVRRFSNGRYLLWFHNHSGSGYESRNPAWLCGGIERNGRIHWSQPEIVLYDPDLGARMSYPDFVEDNGRVFISETQKKVARVHEVEPRLLEALWSKAGLPVKTPAAELTAPHCRPGSELALPPLPPLGEGGGFAIEFWIKMEQTGIQTLLNAKNSAGRGFAVTLTDRGTIEISLNGPTAPAGDLQAWGWSNCAWDCDPELFESGRWHHVVINVDGGPKIITFVVDGVLCDGGEHRQFGWGRFHPQLLRVDFTNSLRLTSDPSIRWGGVRVYDRYLLTAEAVGNFHAGRVLTTP